MSELHAEAAFRRLFEAAPVALVLSRFPDNHVIGANPLAAEMFGLESVAAITGEYGPDYWEDPQDRQRLVDRVRELGRVDGFVTRMKTKHGKIFWADVAVRYITADGESSLLFCFRDVTIQHDLEERLRALATTDALTGVLNRRRLFEVGAAEIDRARRYERALSVCMIDIDDFKRINDERGHATGDEALRQVAVTIRALVRVSDQVGRYGGEELMIVFPETGLDEAATVTERARAAIAELRPIPITVSAGVAQWDWTEDLASLFRRADDAMYAAKAAGKDRVVAR